jgi:amidase
MRRQHDGKMDRGNRQGKSIEMAELTITALQEKMDAGDLNARQLVERYLERIERLDRQGPALNAVIELNPEALVIADALDAERATRGPRGPLHGIPVLIKDNIDTADAMSTTAGSLALVGSTPPQDAFIVQRLREAGAVILGKTNLSEWANARSTHSTSGWSSRGGQTRNPYALDRNPCGSSSGSAVAVAADLCPVAVGTETDGSVICPSHANSVVGIKPTLGLISRSGIIPIGHSQDTAGPMARTVADAALLLGALTGVDPRDPATHGSRDRSHADYTRFLDPRGLRGARIGVARNFFGFHPQVDRIMEACIKEIQRLGAEIIDPANVATADELKETELDVLLYELKADLNAYLADLGPGAPVRSLEEVIAFNERHRDRVMPFFGQEFMLQAQEKGPPDSPAYLEALATNHRLSRHEGIDATLREGQLDAIIAPSGGPAWMTDLVNGDHGEGGSSSPAAVAGYPNVTVPAGYIFGLPIGISFFGGPYQEPTLLRLAYAFEQATRVRQPPQFLPTAPLSA